ncbi:MAG: hypothetical protein ACFKPT_13885 [Gloeotrichia echinulata GP01]
MGRRKTVKQIERELQYAKARAAYNPPLKEDGASTRRLPKIGVRYAVLSPLAAANSFFTIQGSAEGIRFFGGIGSLGLAAAGTDSSAPRGFKPAQVHAMVSDASPSLIRAKGSNRPYVRYGKGSRDSKAQYSYTAPITAAALTGLDEKVKGVFNAVKDNLGGAYGRAWFTNEVYPLAISGVTTGG